MAVFAISDLHLALSIDKPMDIFGDRWSNYMEKLRESWKERVTREDSVIIPGDISWATYLEQALLDFRYIESLPGIKIISKGNHDYWWTTVRKLEQFLTSNNLKTIRFMHNNSFRIENFVLCGTRGWKCPGDEDFGTQDRKIYLRELQRLEISLKSAAATDKEYLIAALHYPPFNSKGDPSQFVEVMKRYGVRICIYGHLHGECLKRAVSGVVEGIDFRLVSADYLNYQPLELKT